MALSKTVLPPVYVYGDLLRNKSKYVTHVIGKSHITINRRLLHKYLLTWMNVDFE